MSPNNHWPEADALYQILSMIAETLTESEEGSDDRTKLIIIDSALKKYERRRWPDRSGP